MSETYGNVEFFSNISESSYEMRASPSHPPFQGVNFIVAIPQQISGKSNQNEQFNANATKNRKSHNTMYNISVPSSSENIGTMTQISSIPKERWGIGQEQQRAGEDRYQVKQIHGVAGNFLYFAIFDGHGGTKKMGPDHVADYCAENLHIKLAENMENIDFDSKEDVKPEEKISEAIINSFVELDTEMYNKKKRYGTTCTVILIDNDNIYQINVGDSRSIIFNDSGIISTTEDHDPMNWKEKERVETAGGFVSGFGRVNHCLSISRAFGDFELKISKQKMYEYDPID